ncbi:stalk domain-containing protein [Paenibacillus sp. 32352]|uniref:stalk domain-containing protein n=1 Tax=Paenibacillus sp. 32352 TaxID=1969111 RepID=UPI0015C4C500|nr:stalk domain-containing protein [Paenibacillus sp. 32352]
MKIKYYIPKKIKAILALAVILGSQSALAQAVNVSPVVQVASAATNTVTVDGYEYSKDVVDALDYINDIRQKAGLSVVKLNPFLAKAAENHANYLVINSGSLGQASAHSEDATKKGYTGVKARDRVTAVGAGTTFKSHIFNEGIYHDTTTLTGAIDSFLAMAYHRDSLIDPNLEQIGLSQKGKTSVIVYVIKGTNSQQSVYPYNGQKNVPLSFTGAVENPNPLEKFGVSKSGFIISLNELNMTSTASVTLKNSKGISLDFFLEDGRAKDYDTWFIYPKKDLEPNETYTVTVNNKTWSFSTITTGMTPPSNPSIGTIVNGKPPREFSSNDVGVRLNGKYIEVTPKAKVLDGSTFIPLRGVLEEMGATLEWNSKTSEVSIIAPNLSMLLKIGRGQALVNQKMVTLSAAPFISEEGSTYVPLRFISETLGAKVSWEPDNYTAVIDTVN